MKLRSLSVVAFACALALSMTAAEARKAPRYSSQEAAGCVLDNSGRQTCAGPENRIQRRPGLDGNGNAAIVAHPAGCPRRAFCGCGVSVKVFGKPIRDLFLAANWLKFPRTSPAAGMVAARPGHVFLILTYNGDGTAMAYDPNSGNGLTRLHTRSLSGYKVVNPHGALASR